MEKQIIKLINIKINELYIEVKTLLFQKDNYKKEVDTHNVVLYFNFLEAALQQPYNRLTSLTAFITDDGQLPDEMYPFAILKKDIKQIIKDKFTQAGNFANSLDMTGIDPDFQTLREEKHLTRNSD